MTNQDVGKGKKEESKTGSIVGIDASAGGLEALGTLLSALPVDTDFSLSPNNMLLGQ